jgi:hypothetical protein
VEPQAQDEEKLQDGRLIACMAVILAGFVTGLIIGNSASVKRYLAGRAAYPMR